MPRPPSPRRAVRSAVDALRDFLTIETAGGALLLAATVAALLWANSPWPAGYERVWETWHLRHWVNDGLMTVFFFVVGTEIRRELTVGELRDRRAAAFPVFGAIGGMVLPALLFVACNPSGPELPGWGIPMATDIAFALGVLALVGRSIPPSIRVFLLTLAIVDDIGAIVVIAIFYSGGVHPTLAGVVFGLLLPKPPQALVHRLHQASSFVIVPLFALGNAGVALDAGDVGDAVGSTVTLGVVLGLVVGKAAGITGAAWLATRAGVAVRPAGASWRHVFGAAALGGIGFTVSLFVTTLAFDDGALVDAAKLGILVASLLASGLGALVLRR